MASSVKTMMVSPTFGRIYFDAVFATDHKMTVKLTEHPVQDGAAVNDHAFIEPDEVTVDIGMTDAMEGAGDSHSVNGFTTLKAIMELREPVELVTRLKVYPSMVITALSSTDDFTTMNALRASVTFTKLVTVSVSTVSVEGTSTSGSKKKKKKKKKKKNGKTGTGNNGNTTQPQNANKSLLKKVLDKLKGKK